MAAAVGVGGTLLWPRLTTSPRPPALEQVNQFVRETEAGAEAARVLGVADEGLVEPLTAKSVLNSVTENVSRVVQEKTQEIVTRQVVNQLISQFDKLTGEQKLVVQEAVCKQ